MKQKKASMRLGKVVLFFQAVMTLVIGMAFLIQVLELDAKNIHELKVEISKGIVFDSDVPTLIDLKQRYTLAGYILLVIGMIELLIILRLMSD